MNPRLQLRLGKGVKSRSAGPPGSGPWDLGFCSLVMDPLVARILRLERETPRILFDWI